MFINFVGEDWKDVQIPAPSSGAPKAEKSEAPAAGTAESSSSVSGTHEFLGVPNVGPASNLLMAQYGIKPESVNWPNLKIAVYCNILLIFTGKSVVRVPKVW